jgi:hypothetical protein
MIFNIYSPALALERAVLLSTSNNKKAKDGRSREWEKASKKEEEEDCPSASFHRSAAVV